MPGDGVARTSPASRATVPLRRRLRRVMALPVRGNRRRPRGRPEGGRGGTGLAVVIGLPPGEPPRSPDNFAREGRSLTPAAPGVPVARGAPVPTIWPQEPQHFLRLMVRFLLTP